MLQSDWLKMHRENQRLAAALAEICQIDDAAHWENGHTGKMLAMAALARRATSPNDELKNAGPRTPDARES